MGVTHGGVPYSIVIPSRHRTAIIQNALRLFPSARVTVEDSEMSEYGKVVDQDRLIPHPPSPRGLGWIDAWIYERTQVGQAVVIVDDDLTHVSCLVGRYPRRITDAEAIRQMIENQIDIANDLGVSVFGWSRHPNPAFFHNAKPFSLNGHIDVIFGVVKRPNQSNPFNPALYVSSRSHLALHGLLHDRFVLIDNRFYFAGALPSVSARTSGTAPGGLEGVRTSEREHADAATLKSSWGRYIDLTPSAKSKNPFGERFRVKRHQE